MSVNEKLHKDMNDDVGADETDIEKKMRVKRAPQRMFNLTEVERADKKTQAEVEKLVKDGFLPPIPPGKNFTPSQVGCARLEGGNIPEKYARQIDTEAFEHLQERKRARKKGLEIPEDTSVPDDISTNSDIKLAMDNYMKMEKDVFNNTLPTHTQTSAVTESMTQTETTMPVSMTDPDLTANSDNIGQGNDLARFVYDMKKENRTFVYGDPPEGDLAMLDKPIGKKMAGPYIDEYR
mmetsp:Transcript_1169/g.1997  ORF Transcript_1169/g.1997 Transcript_1169/m.1997 type:complete len:236 (+) Transcript_1169:3-710(+)